MEILTSFSNKRSGVGGGDGARGGRTILAAAANRSRKLEFESDNDLENKYPDILNFYTQPPSYSISLEEFDRHAVERLKMLRLIERINLTSKVRYSTDYFYTIETSIKSDDLPTYHTLFSPKKEDQDSEEQFNARKIDHISHFLLRLAFARTDEQRKWFITLEVDFFRLKLNKIKRLNPVLTKYNLPYEEVSNEVKNKYADAIGNATFTMTPVSVRSDTFQVFKVHFTHALELVRNRSVFLHKGYAFVPYHELAGVISVKFRSYLSESMSILKKNIHLVEDDERLRPLVIGFEKRHLGSDASVVKSGDAVSVAQLANFSEKSFPLCMKHLYDVVQKDHHLKHWGRLQLGLFFKALGLPLDEATKFWRTNFTKRHDIDAGRFDKQYLYNIRHMYGQEGKRTDYTPYSCMKIIHSSVGPGDHHGCPFRHSDATPLRQKLVDAGIAQDGIKEILNLVEQKHYQIACQKYFEWTHDKLTIDGGVNHPNQYFNESRDILTGKKTIKLEAKAEAKTKRTVYYRDGQQRSQPEQSGDQMDVTEGNEMDDECDEMLAELIMMEH